MRQKLPWDTEISQILKKKFKKVVNDITNILIELRRSILTHKGSLTSVALHAFGDASVLANCEAVDAVLNQSPSTRISSRDLTLPGFYLYGM